MPGIPEARAVVPAVSIGGVPPLLGDARAAAVNGYHAAAGGCIGRCKFGHRELRLGLQCRDGNEYKEEKVLHNSCLITALQNYLFAKILLAPFSPYSSLSIPQQTNETFARMEDIPLYLYLSIALTRYGFGCNGFVKSYSVK